MRSQTGLICFRLQSTLSRSAQLPQGRHAIELEVLANKGFPLRQVIINKLRINIVNFYSLRMLHDKYRDVILEASYINGIATRFPRGFLEGFLKFSWAGLQEIF